MRRVALVMVAAMVLGTGLATTASPAFAKEKKIKSCQKDKNLNANIQAAFIPFFEGATATDKASSVDNGDAIIPMLEASSKAALESGQSDPSKVTYPVEIDATCDGKAAATFQYDLAVNQPRGTVPSTGLGLAFAGDATLVKGKWLITALTICDLIGANPNTPTLGQECQDAALG
jgi:hypothetical protein